MIRIENVSKSNSNRILYIEASAALNRGEKIGLVGPNGAGKTTLFRMITGEEQPDEGQISTEKGVTIGYFDQDVGEMSGRSAVEEVMESSGGTVLGAEPVAHWRSDRFSAPYLRDTLLSAGVLTETLETAASWSALLPLYTAVSEALTHALEGEEGGVVVMCHVSHTYPTGASLYFTVATAAGSAPLERWGRAKRAASEAITAHGGTITHHHAVGRDHREWYDQQRPDLFAAALRAAKSAVDPGGVLNPGVLVDA